MTPTAATAAEVSNVLDTLEALAADLSCDCDVPPDTLILSAQRTRDACAAIEGGVAAMRRILQISVDAGGGPIPPQVAAKLDAAND
jgi:hypothetical protein